MQENENVAAKEAYERYAILRDQHDFTDAIVARCSQVAPTTLSDWKAGRYLPKYDKIVRISAVLDVSPAMILGG